MNGTITALQAELDALHKQEAKGGGRLPIASKPECDQLRKGREAIITVVVGNHGTVLGAFTDKTFVKMAIAREERESGDAPAVIEVPINKHYREAKAFGKRDWRTPATHNNGDGGATASQQQAASRKAAPAITKIPLGPGTRHGSGGGEPYIAPLPEPIAAGEECSACGLHTMTEKGCTVCDHLVREKDLERVRQTNAERAVFGTPPKPLPPSPQGWREEAEAIHDRNITQMVAYKAGPHWIIRLAYWDDGRWIGVPDGTEYKNVLAVRSLPPAPHNNGEREDGTLCEGENDGVSGRPNPGGASSGGALS